MTALETALGLIGGEGPIELANFPASAIGGGARNLSAGRGGDGVRSGDVEGGVGGFVVIVVILSARLRRAGGKAGGGPRLEEIVPPVC